VDENDITVTTYYTQLVLNFSPNPTSTPPVQASSSSSNIQKLDVSNNAIADAGAKGTKN
jgi:hypothetical protein